MPQKILTYRELVATEILALIWSGVTGGMIGLKKKDVTKKRGGGAAAIATVCNTLMMGILWIFFPLRVMTLKFKTSPPDSNY